MIYCVSEESYPKLGEIIEEISYSDENDFEWKVARTKKEFYVKYCGDKYFSNDLFVCDVGEEEFIKIKNTNCFLFEDVDFEFFCDIRDVVKLGQTDEIFDYFGGLLTNRLSKSKSILDSEK